MPDLSLKSELNVKETCVLKKGSDVKTAAENDYHEEKLAMSQFTANLSQDTNNNNLKLVATP